MLDSIYKPCEAWLEKLSIPLDDLSSADRAALEAHLARCPACSLARTDFSMIGRLLRTLPTPEFSSALPPALLQLWEEEDLSVQVTASQDADALSELLPQLQVLTAEEDSTFDHLLAERSDLSDLIPIEALKQETLIASTAHIIPTENHQFSSDISSQEGCSTTEEASESDGQRVGAQTSLELVLLSLLKELSEKDVRDAIEHLAFRWIKDIAVRILNWLKLVRFSSQETLHRSERGHYFLFTIDEQDTSTIKSFIHSLNRCQTSRMMYHVIQVTFDSYGYVTTIYQGKELKESNRGQCKKCGQLVNVPIEFEKGTSIFCNNVWANQQIWQKADCATKGLNADLKELFHSRFPTGGTGTMLLCLNGNLTFRDAFEGECADNIAQMIEKSQHLNTSSILERNSGREYK